MAISHEAPSLLTTGWLSTDNCLGQSQSQDYLKTAGLAPVSSSWRQALWASRPEIFFIQRNPCGPSPYVTSSLMRRWVCLLWIYLAFRLAHIACYWKFPFCTIYEFSVSTGFAKHIIRVLRAWVAPIVLKITPRPRLRRKRSPSIVVETCLPRRCIATVAARVA
jgi:hypothetical protein